MSDTIPTPPAERTPGVATSAVTRDAARLRSVMSDLRREGPSPYTEPAITELVPTPAYLETVMPAPRSQQATELRSPAPAARPQGVPSEETAAADDRHRATRLRSVASLVEMRLADEKRKATQSVPMPEAHDVPRAEPRRQTETAVRHLEIPIYEPEPAGPTYSSNGDGRFRVMMVMAGTVIAGLVLGVGLYAGGGELVSGLFSSEPAVPVDPNPAAITERPIVQVASVMSVDSSAGAAVTAISSEEAPVTSTEPTEAVAMAPAPDEPPTIMENTLPSTAAERPRPEKPLADVVTGSPRTEPAPRVEPKKDPRRSTPRADETAAPRTTSKSFTVQVRATPDQAEAKQIAKKLRGKGAKDVEVVRSEKNGVPFYRVRFKSQGTAGDAQAAAGRAGFSDAWIVRD